MGTSWGGLRAAAFEADLGADLGLIWGRTRAPALGPRLGLGLSLGFGTGPQLGSWLWAVSLSYPVFSLNIVYVQGSCISLL